MFLRTSLLLLSVVVATVLAACSSSGGGEATTPPAGSSGAARATEDSARSGAPEDHIAPDSEVAAGLKELKALAALIAQTATSDSEKATSLAEGLEEFWEPVEGTVKRNDADVYLTVEDAFAELESGDAERSQGAAQDLTDAVDRYLAAHPG